MVIRPIAPEKTNYQICEEFGGVQLILDMLSGGTMEPALAKRVGVPLRALQAYLRQNSPASEYDEAKAAGEDSYLNEVSERVVSDRESGDQDGLEHNKLLLKIHQHRAAANTIKYRKAVEKATEQPIAIHFDIDGLRAMKELQALRERDGQKVPA